MGIQTIKTEYGNIRKASECKDDYENLVTYTQGGGMSVITLQSPAMRSFKESEVALWKKMHPIEWRRRQRRNKEPGREHIAVLAGSKRTCELQASLYRSDPQRYAPPSVGLHTHGLAIDISQAQGARKLKLIYQVLANHDWNKVRPVDEPWHMSFHLTG